MCPKHIRQQRALRMSETKDQMCSVQCWGCGGSLLWKVPWSALIDDTDNDINTDNNCTQCQKKRPCTQRRCGTPTKFNVCINNYCNIYIL